MLRKNTDVAVIGGGIVGLSTGYFLAEKGVRTILLERNLCGCEGSGRNGGGVRQQNRDLREMALAMEGVKIWARFAEELPPEIEYRRTGNLKLAFTEKEIDALKEKIRRENNFGLASEFLDSQQLRELSPNLNPKILAASYCATDGQSNPLHVCPCLANRVRDMGIEILERTPAREVLVSSGKVKGVASDGVQVSADHVVIASGPWTPELLRSAGVEPFPIEPKISQLLVTEPALPLLKHFISHPDYCYIRQAVNGNFHIGYHSRPVKDFDRRSTMECFSHAGGFASYLVPKLSYMTVIRGWSGFTDWTPDSAPVIDRIPEVEGLFVAAGFSGHGFCIGPAVGRSLAEWIVNGTPDLELGSLGIARFRS